jgi:hypothetical protein
MLDVNTRPSATTVVYNLDMMTSLEAKAIPWGRPGIRQIGPWIAASREIEHLLCQPTRQGPDTRTVAAGGVEHMRRRRNGAAFSPPTVILPVPATPS